MRTAALLAPRGPGDVAVAACASRLYLPAQRWQQALGQLAWAAAGWILSAYMLRIARLIKLCGHNVAMHACLHASQGQGQATVMSAIGSRNVSGTRCEIYTAADVRPSNHYKLQERA